VIVFNATFAATVKFPYVGNGKSEGTLPAKSLHECKFWPHVSRVDNDSDS